MTQYFNSSSRLFAAVALVASALISSSSYALEKQVFAGSNCVPQVQTYNIKRYSNGYMANENNTGVQTWNCPITRQTANNVHSVRVSVLDRGFGEEVTCVLRSIKSDGQYYYYHSQTATSHGHNYLYFGPLNAYGANGPLTLRCSIPSKSNSGSSGVYNYLLVE